MTRYRSRLWVVEAEQWFPGRDVAGVCLKNPCDVTEELESDHPVHFAYPHVHHPPVGVSGLMNGQWVVRDERNHVWVMNDEDFRQTYEPDDD